MRLTTGRLFSCYFIVFFLSYIGFQVSNLQPVFFVLALLLFAILTFRRPEYGIYILLGDLFVTSFGYLFQWNGISLRIGMAIVLILIVIFRFLQYVIARRVLTTKQSLNNARDNEIARLDSRQSRQASQSVAMTKDFDFGRLKKFIRQYKGLSAVYVLFVLWIVASFIHGIARNGFPNAFQDFNGFLFLIFLPIIPALKIEKEKVFTILKAGLLWLFVFVSFIEIVFAWFGENVALYTFVRDFRFGEITPFAGDFWRVFLQSEVYAVVGLFLAVVSIFNNVIARSETTKPASTDASQGGQSLAPRDTTGLLQKLRNDSKGFFTNYPISLRRETYPQLPNYVLLFTSFVILLLSLSRSFWLGTGMGLIVLAIFFLKYLPFAEVLRNTLRVVAVFAASAIFVLFISHTWLGAGDVAEKRLNAREPAASSRSAQLGPLQDAIARSPVIGYGFGKELEYRSSDPRRVEQSGGTGLVKTWAIELGWHDVTLKMGLIGTLLYLSFIILLMHRLYRTYRTYIDISRITIFLSLLALVIIHFFTPYLNHPLGIGFLLIAVILLSSHSVDSSEENMVS